MARLKQKRFSEFQNFPNTTNFDNPHIQEELNSFMDGSKITIELGCGKGNYTLGLAKLYPDRKFVGIDIQGERLWRGAKQALEQGLQNAFFVRVQIENILDIFEPLTVEEIWITFPDPFPKDRHAKRRLVSPRFIEIYRQLLVPGGSINLKTDNDMFFEYTLQQAHVHNYSVIENIEDVYAANISDELSIKTDFEQKFLALGQKIHYLKFKI